jgi:import inner membrane translocase subunit TIM50
VTAFSCNPRTPPFFYRMFSAVSRTLSQRVVLTQSTRFLAQKTPKPPLSSKPPSPNENTESKAAETPAATPDPETPLTRSNLPSLDFSPPDPSSEQKRTGASSRDNLSSADRQRRAYARIFFGLFTLGIGFHVAYMGREWDGEELERKRMVCFFLVSLALSSVANFFLLDIRECTSDSLGPNKNTVCGYF